MYNVAGVVMGLGSEVPVPYRYTCGICREPVPAYTHGEFAGRAEHECVTCRMVLCRFHAHDCELRSWSEDLQRYVCGCDDWFCEDHAFRHQCGGWGPWIHELRNRNFAPPDMNTLSTPSRPDLVNTPGEPVQGENRMPNVFQIRAVPKQLPLIVVISVFLVYFVRTAGATEDLSNQFL